MNILKLPTGRSIAAEYKGIYLVDKYAPSGTARRTEREYFYNTELPQLLHAGSGDLVIGGDFNCVTDPIDTTCHYHTSRALSEMIRRLHLTDTWSQHQNRPTHTRYHTAGASRIERIYISIGMMHRKTSIEILPAAFANRNAVVLRLVLGEMRARRGRARWKLNPTMLRDADLLTPIRQQWKKWKLWKSWYPNVKIWWDRYVKRHLQQYLKQWGADCQRENKVMEYHLYQCIYDIQSSDITPDKKKSSAKQVQSKIGPSPSPPDRTHNA